MVFHTQQIFCQHQLTKGDRSENIPYPTLTKGGKGGDGVSEPYPTLTKGDKKTSFKLSAFSLIELSIVLIIMGLLVAGVTGGQSLIQSAKARAVINEATGYKRAVNIFYAKNGRLLGDPDEVGQIAGKCGYYNDNCKIYDGIDYDFALDPNYDEYVNAEKAAFYDMDKEGILDFNFSSKNNEWGYGSKILKQAYYIFILSNHGDLYLDSE